MRQQHQQGDDSYKKSDNAEPTDVQPPLLKEASTWVRNRDDAEGRQQRKSEMSVKPAGSGTRRESNENTKESVLSFAEAQTTWSLGVTSRSARIRGSLVGVGLTCLLLLWGRAQFAAEKVGEPEAAFTTFAVGGKLLLNFILMSLLLNS